MRKICLFIRVPLCIIALDTIITALIIIGLLYSNSFGIYLIIALSATVSVTAIVIMIIRSVTICKKIYDYDVKEHKLTFINF